MSEDGSGELVNRFYELGDDIDAVLALLAADFQLVYSGPSIIPATGTWKGHDGFRKWSEAALQGHLPPESLNVEEQIVHGDKVVIRGHVKVRVKTTGRPARPTSSICGRFVTGSSRAGSISMTHSPWLRRT